jgi:hypothetical protein
LANDPIVTPFIVPVGDDAHNSTEMSLVDVLGHLEDGGPHSTTSQPAPEVYAERFRQESGPVLAITVSGALSGSLNAANQERTRHASIARPRSEGPNGGMLNVHRDNFGVDDARKVWHALRRTGTNVGRDQVARRLRLAGLHGVSR